LPIEAAAELREAELRPIADRNRDWRQSVSVNNARNEATARSGEFRQPRLTSRLFRCTPSCSFS